MKKKSNFKFIFAIYVSVLVILTVAALIAMKFFLDDYEKRQPDKIAEEQLGELVKMAKDGTIDKQFLIPERQMSRFEEGMNTKEEYTKFIASGKATCSVEDKQYDKEGNYTSITYLFSYGNVKLGRIKVAMSNKRTHLLFFDFYECRAESVQPIADPTSYDITVPSGFTVKLNGLDLGDDELVVESEEEKTNSTEKHYHVDGLYFEPDFELYAPNGQLADHVISKNTVVPVLILPKSVNVTVDGKTDEGTVLENDTVFHQIKLSEKHEVVLSDKFENTIRYDEKTRVPLTYKVIYAPEDYTVFVDGKAVPKDSATLKKSETPDAIAEYCSLPDRLDYNVAVLKRNAEISITDKSGKAVEIDPSGTVIDISPITNTLESVPEEITSQIDVLKVAETWSLLMSQDLYDFNTLAAYLVDGTDLYNQAVAWVNGVDITFTSIHVLADPPFTEEEVTNFNMLSDECFCCDVYLVKQMILDNGESRSDPMDSTLYFVKQDGYYGPEWKLIYMETRGNDEEVEDQ